MSDQKEKEKNDISIKSSIFIRNNIYPDAASIFSLNKTLDETKTNSLIVLDTNILLAPYTIGEENLLEQCRKIYTPLSHQKRLIVPGQVAREFADHRATKLTELFHQLSVKQIPTIQKGKYPLLSALSDYKELINIEKEIDQTLRDYMNRYEKVKKKVLSHIQSWRWNDPVSSLYNEIFTKDTIVDPSINQEDLLKDLENRQQYNIPPGYKDRAKQDNGIGDLLIWHTILEIGKKRQQDIIFVSGDEKSDWYHKSQNTSLYPRFELINEYHNYTGGFTLHIIKFSRFLELFNAEEETIEEVKKEEKQDEAILEKVMYLKKIVSSMTPFINSWPSVSTSNDINIIGIGYIDQIRIFARETANNLSELLTDPISEEYIEDNIRRHIYSAIESLHLLARADLYLEGGESISAFKELGNLVFEQLRTLGVIFRGRISEFE